MNHIYRVVFNKETGTYQAVSEIAKQSHKSHSSKGGKLLKALLTPLSLAIGALSALSAYAAPTGGQVTAGVADITQTGNITSINQSSQNAAINWQSFNVGKNETVNFNQPNAQSVTLNRVIGNEKSVIDGAMNANGKVFISNANGMLIGKDAKINVGSLVATTANISDEDFMSGRYAFENAKGSIENLGHISVPKGGVVALIAPIVKNSGKITAPEGNVLLASAENFSITLPDNANFKYTLDKGTLQGLVDNGGAILADGGRVVLTAKGVDRVKKSLIKHSGNIEANTVQNKNGVIELLGDLDHSALNVSGSLKAEGKGDDKGGFIETSSAQLNFDDNVVISTKSETGQTGTWLIDPKDFTVASSGGDITGAKVSEGLQSNNVTLKSRDGAKEGKGDVIINDEINWNKNTLTLNAENDIHINKTMNGSGTAKLALEYGQGTSDGGDSDYYLDKNTPLKDRTVKVNLPEGKNFSVKKGSDGEVVEFDVIHKMPEIVKNTDGDWESKFTTHNIAFGTDMDVSHTKNYDSFAGWQLKNNSGDEWGRVAGLGHTVKGLSLHSKKDNQPTGLFQRQRDNDGYLRDIGVIDVNVHSDGRYSHTGGLVGYGHNISNSYATGSVSSTGHEADIGGLVGIGFDVLNSYATGSVSSQGGSTRTGGLVGDGGYISNSYATGSVSSTGWNAPTGGLMGYGTHISNSYATGNVSSTGEYVRAGGLVGIGFNVLNSYATGSVSSQGGSTRTGGLVGDGHNISNSYASNESVSATGQNSTKGGLIGTYYSESHHYINNSFFNQDKQPQLQAIGKIENGNATPNNVTGKTESELKQKSTYQGWDETIWDIQDGKLPTLRHTTNTVTPPTVSPVTPPPVVNVDFEPAKKSLADTKLYRQNMLNRMVIFAKNGEFAKLNIDQTNDNIRKEIAKTQALIDALPDGVEKTNLQNQLNAITALTRDEIQNAEKLSNDVAKQKQQEQQAKEQAEKDKKEAYDAVSALEKSRQSILDNYYNQAKNGKLLDGSNVNSILSQNWLNAKNKVNKVSEQSEKDNLNRRLATLGVLTQAEIDKAKAFVKAYQDNQARLEEEKKRAEEARRKAEEEKRKAEQQAKEQERIQALFKDAQNLVQQAKSFADRSQSLVDNGRTNDVATLNKNLTAKKQQAQASIDKLPNNATKTLLQRQLNEIALIKANGGVNNPQVKPVEKPNTEHEKTDKERKHILQINHDVVTEQVNKKPEKPIPVIDTNAIAIKECNLNKNCATAQDIKNTKLGKIPDVWKNGILSEDNNLEDLKKVQIVLDKQSLYSEGTKIVKDLFDLRNHLNNVSHEVSMYTHGIDDSVKLRKGKESISIKDYIDAQIEQNLLNNKLKKLDENQRFLDGKFDEVIAQDPEKTKLLDDSIKNRNKAFEGVEKIRNQARQEKSNKANLFWDIFWKEVYKVGDALSVGVSGFKAMTSSVTAPLKNAGEKLTYAQNLIKTTTETADNGMKIINVAKSITDVFVSINDPNVSNAESWQVAAYATSDLIQMLQDDNLTTFLGGVTNVSQMLDSARTMHSYATSMQSISQIPDELLHPDDKKILIRVYQDKMYKEYKKTAQSMTSIFGSITGTSGYTDALNNSIDAIDGALDVFKNDEYTRLAEKMIDIKNDVDKTRSAYHEGIKHHAGITLNKLLIIGEAAEVVKPKEANK